jgi:hypothetical protein
LGEGLVAPEMGMTREKMRVRNERGDGRVEKRKIKIKRVE